MKMEKTMKTLLLLLTIFSQFAFCKNSKSKGNDNTLLGLLVLGSHPATPPAGGGNSFSNSYHNFSNSN